MTTFRTDIQALRGLAVLLVLLDHAGIIGFQAGYLGVDLFFVISGYLITRLIQKGIDHGNFSFAEFYSRRAKRLLPAAYVTFFFTTLLSALLLTSLELHDFIKQLIGAVTFTANIALWYQTGYFQSEAALKPLLHVWSLAVEEQYYLLIPALLVFTPRRYWALGAGLILIASLVCWLVLMRENPEAAFYLLPTRAWELALGSMGMLAIEKSKAAAVLSKLFWPCLLLLFIVPMTPAVGVYPGMNIFVVCVATLVVIMRRHPLLHTSAPARRLAKVGDFSYSLYLVHWPLFALVNNVWVGEQLPIAGKLALLSSALALGYLLYRTVELPVRSSTLQVTRKSVAATFVASLVLVAIPLTVARTEVDDVDYAFIRRTNTGFGASCELTDVFRPSGECQNAAHPKILVWGDSFAMHLVPGIADTSKLGVVQATKSWCGPFLDFAPIDTAPNTPFNKTWAEQCIGFNQSVLDYLAKTASVEVVVLASPFAQYLNDPGNPQLLRSGARFIEGKQSIPNAVQAMQRTAQGIRALGKRVVVIAPPPSAKFNVGKCLERKASGKLSLGAYADCDIPEPVYRKLSAPVLEFLSRLPGEAKVDVVSFDPFLCKNEICVTSIDGTFVYRDGAHLSYDGSRLLAQRMGLVDSILAAAK